MAVPKRIPKRFDNETKETILQRMLANSPKDIDKRQGSVTWDVLSPVSIELERNYIALDLIPVFGFVNENQPREYLILRCAEVGVFPKPANKSSGTVTISGDDGTKIPKGTRVYKEGEKPVYFVTTEEGTIANGQVTVPAEAEKGGADGNVPAGAITLHVGNIVGVASVINEVPFEGGTDEESDESLMQRYFERVSMPATSGNKWHYRQWAKEVPGVSDAKVYPGWNGINTIKVVILDEDKRTPSQTLLDNVYSYIEDNRPICVDVTVEGAIEKPFTIAADIVVAENYTIQQIQLSFQKAITDYFKSIAFVDSYVSYAQIGRLLFDVKGVLDYSNLTLNGGTANVALGDTEVPVLDNVTLNAVVM